MRVKITRSAWCSDEKLSEAHPSLLNYPDLEERKTDLEWVAFITLNTMEDLCRLIKDVDNSVVVSFCDDECEVEIYDDYRE